MRVIDFIKAWVMNIVAIVIFMAIFEILAPSGKIKKFVSVASGFILLIVIINPLLHFKGDGLNPKEFQLADSHFMDRKEIEQKSKILRDNQVRQITEVYRKKIIERLEETAAETEGVAVARADVIINEDSGSSSFGEIKRVYLYLSLNSKDMGIKPVKEVERIEIKRSGSAKKDEEDNIHEGLKEMLKDKICRTLGVSEENIVISLETAKEDLNGIVKKGG